MKFLEKDLEEIIFNSSREKLSERGLDLKGVIKRQLKIGKYGVSDLVTFDRVRHLNYYSNPVNRGFIPVYNHYLDITVYELKKDKISMSAFLQAVRYAKGIKRFLVKRGFEFEIRLNIHLIGKTIDNKSDFIYLSELFDSVLFSTYDYDIDGIIINDVGNYSLTKEGF